MSSGRAKAGKRAATTRRVRNARSTARRQRSSWIVDLQRTAGNRAVAELLRAGTPVVSRQLDAGSVESPAVDDPSFNPDTIAHDLLRAIDQEDYTPSFDGYVEDKTKERRKVDADKVISSLEGLTASQVAEVERRYFAFESQTTLEQDLFEGGQSDRQSNLTPDQRVRIGLLLKGTKAEPLSQKTLDSLKEMPPAAAAQMRAALLEQADADAALVQFQADAVELHQLLADDLNEAQRERVMSLHRKPVKAIDAMDTFYAQQYGGGQLAYDLALRLQGLQSMRVTELRMGNWAQADAIAIEDKRRAIEELNKEEAKLDGDVDPLMRGEEEILNKQREKKKEELTGDIGAIIDMNRQEALADRANAGKSSSDAVAERVNKILGQQDGEVGTSLGDQLNTTLGREHAAGITAIGDQWNTAGGASLAVSAGYELAAMEKAGTTNAGKMIATLRSFRDLAKRDVLATVQDPNVPVAEKQQIGANPEAARNAAAHRYVDEYIAAYDGMRGSGRTYQQIVDSASDADTRLLENLALGGGQTSDAEELRHAIGKRDVDAVKGILRKQPNGEAIDSLVSAYNQLDGGRDLRGDLFGRDFAGQASEQLAERLETRGAMSGLVVGRDAEQIAELLSKPGATAMAAGAEVAWLAEGGAREYDITMANRGTTGHLREIGGDPETERLLEQSKDRLTQLMLQWDADPDPAHRRQLIHEITKVRATLSGDADAYEKDNARVLGEIQSALSFAVAIALAVAIPGAGAGLAAFLETTALNVALNVAANVVIKGDEYGWKDLQGDVLGGVLGAGGGKFGEEVLGKVAAKIAAPTGEAAVGAAERAGIDTALAKEAGAAVAAGDKATIALEEFDVKVAGNEAAGALTKGSETLGAAAAGPAGATIFEQGMRELGGFVGGLYGGKLPSGDLSLSPEEILKALITTGAGKAAHHPAAAGGEASAADETQPAAAEGPRADEVPATGETPATDEARPAEDAARQAGPEPHAAGTRPATSAPSDVGKVLEIVGDNEADAFLSYRKAVAATPGREVALLYNHALKRWAIVQGAKDMVPVGQTMRDMGWDPSDTVVARHSHPVGPSGDTSDWNLLASGRGGDLPIIAGDASKGPAHDNAQWSAIDVVVNGKPDRTWVFFDPSTGYYTISYPEPGGHASRSFRTIEAYHAWFKNEFGFEPGSADGLATGPAAPDREVGDTKGTRPAAPEDLTQLEPGNFLDRDTDEQTGAAAPAAKQLDPAEWQSMGTVPEGNNPKEILKGPDGQLYMFKPAQGETENPYNEATGITAGQRYRRAAAAAEVMERLGIDTPGVTLVTWRNGPGSLQGYRPELATPSLPSAVGRFENSQARKDLDAADFVLGSMDRHARNYKIEYDGDTPKLTAFDNDAAFPPSEGRFSTPDPSRLGPSAEQVGDLQDYPRGNYQREAPATVSEKMAQSLRDLDANFPEADLRQWLTADEVAGARARVRDLVTELDAGTIRVVP